LGVPEGPGKVSHSQNGNKARNIPSFTARLPGTCLRTSETLREFFPVANKVQAINVPAPRLLGVNQAAAYLGTTSWMIRKLVWAKEIAHIRLGQRLLFGLQDLNKFVDSQKILARS
jgi:excisionase family DNA binding protein